MSKPLQQRQNLLPAIPEHWRPPYLAPTRNPLDKLKAKLIRFFDIQAGTIYDDLSGELRKVKGKVLDVGCGIQPYRHLFPADVAYQGLDTVDSKAHFGYEAPDTLYFSGDTWPVKGGSADFILCTETLEHVPDPQIFLRETARCLRPGGRILLTVPFEARWHFIPHDYWRFTPSGLEVLLKQSGFSNIKVFARGNQLTVVCYKVMAFIYSLLFPVPSNFLWEWICRFIGFLAIPLFLTLALLANFTLGKEGRVDCLGYTITAGKKKRAQ